MGNDLLVVTSHPRNNFRKPTSATSGGGSISNITPISRIDVAPSHEELLTPEELATKLKVSKSTVFELTRKRTAGSRLPMPKLKVGKFVRFRYSEVITWMEKNGQAA